MSLPLQQEIDTAKIALPNNSLYPVEDDIYNQSRLQKNINPEDVSTHKSSIPKHLRHNNAYNFGDEMSGDDLDIPGAELDDLDEAIGSEDEENNYYSLGGDNHNDLEENKGD
ncbi:MAG: hypothetical protein QM541_03050 [Flavobacterium sp.]|nr:hypothetical protein [Flavobacterium sp.]